jgi:hypothetical protein|nr:MAG TPA: cell division protein [Caudoviricetes sp.]
MSEEMLFGILMVILFSLIAIACLLLIQGLTLYQIREQVDEIKNDTAFLKQHND